MSQNRNLRWLSVFVLTPALLAFGARHNPAGAASPEQTTFAPNLEIVDVPTASTLYARMFHLSFRAFPMMTERMTEGMTEGMTGGSGILLKGLASFNNSLSLGVAVKANNIIGSGNIDFEEDEDPVAAVAKLKLFTISAAKIQAALGYDGLGYGVTRQKGLYLVTSKDMTAGLFYFRVHLGAGAIRLRSFNLDDDLNLFLGASAALSEELFLGFEYDDCLNQDEGDSAYGSANAMIGYAWDVGLRLELGFKRLFRGVDRHYRVLKILYTF